MLDNHKEFFQKLAKLCDEYQVTILDSGSIRKGVIVTFHEEVTNSTEINTIEYEKFEVGPFDLIVADENGEVIRYK